MYRLKYDSQPKSNAMDSVMDVFKMCFKSKKRVKFTARSSVIIRPVSGRVTEVDDANKDVWSDQYTTGDQSDKHRIPFYNSGFSTCPKCGERNMNRFEAKAGVRLNGEIYGTEIFKCKTKDCHWKTSFKFDDKDPDNWHTETSGWPRGIRYFPHSYMLLWVNKHRLPALLKHQIFLQKIDGDKLLHLSARNLLKEILQTDDKTVKKIRKAICDKHGSILLH